MKPSNLLYSCSFPSADFALQFNRHAITSRYLTVEAELQTARGGQKLDKAASDSLRRLCTLGGTITLTRRRMRFTDGSGWYESAVLEIDVLDDQSALMPNDPQSLPGARQPQTTTRKVQYSNVSSDRTTTENDARTAHAHHAEDFNSASQCLVTAICGCGSVTQW